MLSGIGKWSNIAASGWFETRCFIYIVGIVAFKLSPPSKTAVQIKCKLPIHTIQALVQSRALQLLNSALQNLNQNKYMVKNKSVLTVSTYELPKQSVKNMPTTCQFEFTTLSLKCRHAKVNEIWKNCINYTLFIDRLKSRTETANEQAQQHAESVNK